MCYNIVRLNADVKRGGLSGLLFDKKKQQNNKNNDDGIINVDSMYTMIGEDSPAPSSAVKTASADGIIQVDEMFTYLGEEPAKKKQKKSRFSGHSRFDITRYWDRKKVMIALVAMLFASTGMSGYTVLKVDANITEMKADTTLAAEEFADEGVDAFTDTEDAIEKSTKKLMKSVKSAAQDQSDAIEHDKRVADFLNALDDLADRIIANNFWYSNANNSPTYEGALRKKKVTNCARYVSWACQEAGLISRGSTFWLNTRINGNSGAVTGSPYLKVSYPRATASSLDLQPGDIVGWGTKGGQHTAVYAGRDANGNMTWYSAGGDGAHRSGGKKYFDSKMKARPRHSYDRHRIDVLIRIV